MEINSSDNQKEAENKLVSPDILAEISKICSDDFNQEPSTLESASGEISSSLLPSIYVIQYVSS